MQLLIVDEKNPQRILRLTITPIDDEASLARGELDVEELRADQLFDLLHRAPKQQTLIVRSSALTLSRPTPRSWQELVSAAGR